MSQEIEKYLLKKLGEGLESPKVPLAKEFEDLKELLSTKLDSCSSSDVPVLRAYLYSLNDVFSECQALSGKNTLLSPTVFKIKQNLSKIKAEIENIKPSDDNNPNGSLDTPQNNGQLQASLSDAREFHRLSSRSEAPPKVYGFDDEITHLEKLLVRRGSIDYFKTVGIVGMRGAGKTTLCQLILTKPEVKNHFVPRIWVHMSTKDNEEDNDPKIAIVKRMLNSLGVEGEMLKTILDEHGLAGLLCALHVELMRKRHLIVLDDAQDTGDWYSNLNASLPRHVKWEQHLAYGLPKGYGGTVIVTSRNEEVMKMMVGEENIYRLLPLSNKDLCWDIFRDEVEQERKPFQPRNEEELKREVIQKCAGVPLAAKMMGKIMREGIRDGSVTLQTIQTQISTDSLSIGQ
ncbi:hypothetical protein P3X46_033347 [Hevea brasiliensis]|uniref:NB-ARC domain-containing protein n=1 Tax=Hevea brasiliensis TaxID=3981 RepID=A0ABQ9KG59_HEVBR|nr:probable disease resistance protein At5g45440 [Hevea brasiliensis]KAJ9136255.1 hypothetical protein P3X46_033347 [Hevea brasiliensis]